MKRRHGVAALSVLVLAGSGCQPAPSLSSDHAEAIRDSVRQLAETMAADLTSEGPAAWRRFFADTSTFYMAAEGRMIFAGSESATPIIQDLARLIPHLELRWTGELRVDPLVPGLATLAAPYYELRVDTAGVRVEETGFLTALVQHRAAGWQLLNAHWSVQPPPGNTP